MDTEHQARQSNASKSDASVFPDTLLATRFLIPTASHEIIARPHLLTLLNEGLSRRLILLSAAAGFGKTTLLAQWVRSFPSGHPPVAWVSLDSGDNVPFQFWTYVLTALEQCQPGLSHQPFAAMHDTPQPSWQAMLTALINSLATRNTPLVLVLDNYEEITEPAIHALLSSLLKHSPPTLCLVLATRTDPPFSLARLHARAQILELRAEQLRATREEITLFLQDVMDLRLSEQSIQDVGTHIQGWWAAMQLAALALQKQTVATPKDLLQAFQGSQPALFEYLVQEVLHRQPQKVQAFLLRTSILPQLCDSLCNAVLEQQESQLFLEELERDNLFLNLLDKQHQWYAYHPLFAEVLRTQLERNAPNEVPALRLRASQWYAAHYMHSEAIQQALLAQEWPWAAQLVEQIPSQHIWGQFKDALLLSWIEQLPREVVRERPRLCLACAQSQFWIASPGSTESWLHTARDAWKAAHQHAEKMNNAQLIHEPEAPLSLLGEIAALQATLVSFYYGDAGASQALCQEALIHLQEQQWAAKIQVIYAQSRANIAQGYFERSIQHMQTGLSRIRAEGDHLFAMIYLWEIVWGKMMTGHLHEAWQLSQQLTLTLQNDEGHQPMRVCWPYTFQAGILYEWNRLKEARDLAEQAVQIGEQAELVAFLPCGYTMLLKLALSQERWEEALKITHQMAYVGRMLSSPYHTALWCCVDQMRFWLACGDITQARRWARDLQREAPLVSSLAREKQSIALARLLLAESQPQHVLNVLDPFVQRAEATQRWYSALEMLLMQVKALHMLQQRKEASVLLAHAVHVGAPEGYMRRFVDEGPIIAELLSQFGEQEQCEEDRLYIKRLLPSFCQRQEMQPSPREIEPSLPLLDPLSAREQEVLQLLAHGTSNQEIAEALVISPGTVKHHVSNILSKLEVANRTQAVARARKLGLLSAEE